MPRFRTVAAAALLVLQAGCAVSPSASGSPPPASGGPPPVPAGSIAGPQAGERLPLLLNVAGGSSVLGIGATDGEALVASRVDLGLDDDFLRYRATYRLEPGDVFSFTDSARAASGTPSVLAGQHFGQDVVVTLPELAGAPLSLGMTAEVQDSWQLGGEAQAEQERAQVEWSPWRATVRVQWTDRAQAFDPSLALHCNVESSLGLPLYAEGHRGPLMQVSGRECVIAEGTEFAGLPVQTWGIGWSWTGDARESAARVRVIEPMWSEVSMDGDFVSMGADFEPGYQLGLSHRRSFGALSAAALVAVRQSPVLLLGAEPALAAETSWSANASLTWQLPVASVSADWAQGVDPLWFMPTARAPRDRFGLALDLSHWIESVAPGTSPVLGMRWNWSELRGPGATEVDENSLELNVSLLF